MNEDLNTAGVTFVTSVNNRAVLENNFLISPCFQDGHPHQILLQENFPSAARAYNQALENSVHDLVIFAHQDMIFPATWLAQVQDAITSLARTDPHWGVLGVFGIDKHGENVGYVYSTGQGRIGAPLASPQPVQTLDEIVLILRKSSGLRFNERLPHFHFYGVDICLAAQSRGMQSYTIPAFCIHNTQFNLVMPREFYESYHALKKIWKQYLPIQTTCIRMTRFDSHMYVRRLREFKLRHSHRKDIAIPRRQDGRQLLGEVEMSNSGSPAQSPSR
ncbi:MAG: hypothetical protein QOG55_1750 [Acidobacteriaceae bacterium]|jgi:hypothetical protein|nr:hypothetical protein [Acidobacteriaceae bacterium]